MNGIAVGSRKDFEDMNKCSQNTEYGHWSAQFFLCLKP